MSFFSVVIPLYNKETHIIKTLQSVIDQSFKDFEIIIVNDGSTDDSLAKAKEVKDSRISIYTTHNKGVSAARNHGVKLSKTQYICFLDADDHWLNNHLQVLKSLIENHPNCGLYATAYNKHFNNSVFKAKYNLEDNFNGIIEDYFKSSLIDSIAWTSCVTIPKRIIEKFNGFDTTLKSGQDTDLWIRIALNEKVAFHNIITAEKILTNSDSHLSKSEAIRDRKKLLSKYLTYEKENPSFKCYMDQNRFSIAIERKLAGDFNSFKKISNDIDLKNLNYKLRLLLFLPKGLLKYLIRIQQYLIKKNLYISPFR